MTTIPRYTGPQIQTDPLRLPQATPESFGVRDASGLLYLGRGLQNLSGTTQQIILDHKAKGDRAAIRDHYDTAGRELRESANAQVFSKRGEEAVDSYAVVNKLIAETKKKYLSAISDPIQREGFEVAYDSLGRQLSDRAFTHENRAIEEYSQVTLDADTQLHHNLAVDGHEDGEIVAVNEMAIMANIDDRWGAFGVEKVEAEQQKARYALYEDLLSVKASANPTNAKEFFQANLENFNPKRRGAISDELDKLEIKDMGLAHARFIIRNESRENADAAAIQAAGGDAKLLSEIRAELDYHYNREDKISEEALDDRLDRAFRKIDETLDINDIPRDLDYAFQIQMRDYVNKRIQGQTTIDLRLYEELITLSRTDPDKFANMKLAQHFPQLTQTYYDKLKTLQQTTLNRIQSAAANEKYVHAMSFQTYINDFVNRVAGKGIRWFGRWGGRPDPSEDEKLFIRNLFESHVNQYPEKDRFQMDTWNNVADLLTSQWEVDESLLGRDYVYWQTVQKGLTRIETESGKPVQYQNLKVPANAIYVNKADSAGVIHEGFLVTDPNDADTGHFYYLDGRIDTWENVK